MLEWGDYMDGMFEIKENQVDSGDAHGMEIFRARIRNSGILDAGLVVLGWSFAPWTDLHTNTYPRWPALKRKIEQRGKTTGALGKEKECITKR